MLQCLQVISGMRDLCTVLLWQGSYFTSTVWFKRARYPPSVKLSNSPNLFYLWINNVYLQPNHMITDSVHWASPEAVWRPLGRPAWCFSFLCWMLLLPCQHASVWPASLRTAFPHFQDFWFLTLKCSPFTEELTSSFSRDVCPPPGFTINGCEIFGQFYNWTVWV